MGRADYLAVGDWNAACDQCGLKRKGSTLRKQWNGLFVCQENWEPRQPQDFVRAIQEHPTPPFVRKPEDEVVAVCTIGGVSALPDSATPDCVINDYIHPAFDATVVY